ncbi:TPA_asm: FtsK [Anelosimus tangle-web spider MELD virus]|nr:TPA_asm: FtsK [Anelosimus tangle-web spider MELD virus]
MEIDSDDNYLSGAEGGNEDDNYVTDEENDDVVVSKDYLIKELRNIFKFDNSKDRLEAFKKLEAEKKKLAEKGLLSKSDLKQLRKLDIEALRNITKGSKRVVQNLKNKKNQNDIPIDLSDVNIFDEVDEINKKAARRKKIKEELEKRGIDVNKIDNVDKKLDQLIEKNLKRKKETDDEIEKSEIEEPPPKKSKESTKTGLLIDKLNKITKSLIHIPLQSNILINGITKSGKSTFISNLFSPQFWSFKYNLSGVYLFSKIAVQEAWTNLKKNLDRLKIPLYSYQSLEKLWELKTTIPNGSILIVDDFMVDAIKDKKLMSLLTDLFNVTTHHNNIISIFTLHNLFADGFRTMRLNSDYIFLFSNPVDVNSTKVFFKQLDANKFNLLFTAYQECIKLSKFLGVKIEKTMKHEYYCGFEEYIMFVTDSELQNLKDKYQLKNE